ncbi:MAG: hypothetical protein IKN12_07635 [Selenomonadaceae bacterium]|nr:hypothetical protein [Selenomonadaceae bacterium]MBR3722625.1 hypothetical protein [Selenomonadaceae bacterium]
MEKDEEYEVELEKARAEYKDLMERGEDAMGDDDEYDELEREFFTEEEIKECEFKALLLEAFVKAHKKMGLDKKKAVELSLEFLDEMKSDNLVFA